MNSSRVLVVIAIGKRYEKLLLKKLKMFRDYAKKCNAEFQVIKTPLDTTFHRPIYFQKMLIASAFSTYEEVLFLDLDITITKSCPDIFAFFRNDKGFGAVLDPRGTEKFKLTWSDNETVLAETTDSYFTRRNFEANKKLQGSINGGVMIFRPQLIGELFSNYYFSQHDDGQESAFRNNEEPPMAYISQTQDLFEALDYRFNTQVIYELRGTPQGRVLWEKHHKKPALIKKLQKLLTGSYFLENNDYRDLVLKIADSAWIIHFSDHLPIADC